jgi:hypothetical protein
MPVRRQRIRNPRSNVPVQNLKWSIDRASREFRLAQNTLRKYLHQGDVEPDADGCFTTLQICECLYGDLHAEKIRKERELVRKYQLENEITEASVLDRKSLSAGFAAIADAIKSRIMASELSRDAKDDLLRDLASIPVVLDNVARAQTKLRRSNGQAEEVASKS